MRLAVIITSWALFVPLACFFIFIAVAICTYVFDEIAESFWGYFAFAMVVLFCLAVLSGITLLLIKFGFFRFLVGL